MDIPNIENTKGGGGRDLAADDTNMDAERGRRIRRTGRRAERWTDFGDQNESRPRSTGVERADVGIRQDFFVAGQNDQPMHECGCDDDSISRVFMEYPG